MYMRTQDPELRRHEADHGPDVVLVYSLAAAAFFALSRIWKEINFYMKKNIKIDFLPSRFGKWKWEQEKVFKIIFMVVLLRKMFAWGPRISGHAQISGTASLQSPKRLILHHGHRPTRNSEVAKMRVKTWTPGSRPCKGDRWINLLCCSMFVGEHATDPWHGFLKKPSQTKRFIPHLCNPRYLVRVLLLPHPLLVYHEGVLDAGGRLRLNHQHFRKILISSKWLIF